MSYDNDTADHAIRALKEEVAKIREEQFAKSFPLNSGGRGGGKLSSSIGGSLPTTGTATFIPNVIRLTKDTGVINKLNYKTLVPNMEFAINETITNNENLNGSINGNAKVDGTLYTQTGRGHLNAGSASIIVEGVATPYEIHFIDNAKNNGQIVLLRAQNGQTIRLRRAITTDANTGNLDLDSSFNIIENAIVILQYQGASNVTSDGGWVPVLSSVTSGGAGNVFDFPILYPKEDLGDQSGAVGLSLNQANGHYKRIRMIGNISLTFCSPPPSSNGFKFFDLLMHDFNIKDVRFLGFTDSPSFTAHITSETSNARLYYSVTGAGSHHAFYVDNGVNANMEMRLNVNKSNVNLDMVTNDIINLDQAQFDAFGGFVSSIDHGQRRISGGNSGININVPKLKTVKLWFENTGQTNSDLKYEFRQDGLDMYTNNIFNVQGIFFPNAGSIIDLAGFGLEFLAGVNPPFGTGNLQTMNFRVRGSAPSYTQSDMFVLDGLGHNTTNGGGMKMSTDLNLQTQNIHNVDMINFSSNNGIVGGNQFAIAGSTDANRLEFNVPFFKSFSFRENDTEFMSLEEGLLTMNFVFSDPRIRANQFELLTHTLGTSGMVDGMIRQVNNGGSLDIMVDSGVIGFGEYGSAVNAGNTKLQWSVPLGKFYDWQVNLTSIATLNTASFHMKTNTFITNPSIIADG